MDDLIAFLRARLDEDEQIARDAGDCWHECGVASISFHDRFDPDRMLREVESARRILDVVFNEVRGMEFSIDLERGCGVGGPTDDASGPLFRFLALPYLDHPDYQETWKPL